MAEIPTVVVKNKKGHLMRINVIDFDPKIHEAAGAEASDIPEAPQTTPDARAEFEAKVAAARSGKSLAAIADEYGISIPEGLKTMSAVRAHLLSHEG